MAASVPSSESDVNMPSLVPISINGNTLDPAAPTVRTVGLGTGDAADSNYILIQIKGRLTKENKDELQYLKVGIKELVSDNTYLCRYEPSELEPIRDLDFVKRSISTQRTLSFLRY